MDVLPRAVSALVGEALMVLAISFRGRSAGMGMGAAPNLSATPFRASAVSSSR
ncbi:MAG: hypothetical protein ACLS4Z_08290 [Christensenellaceae bacterium]